MLNGKHIVIGVTGGIAVYKVVDVVSRLKKLGADITVIMTKHATEFVTPLTFRSLSLNYVVVDMFEEPKTWNVEHISIAQRADLFLMAPATANIMGKMVSGIADDMVSTVVMATKAPVFIAPAMNTGMYTNPVVQRNMADLKSLGYHFIDPDSGRLACGDIGMGKLASPERIVETISNFLVKKDFEGKKILITAGPTQEALDPVRYITNHSSGKMGYAIAEAARDRGADVTLISGRVNLDRPAGIEIVDIVSTEDMYQAVMDKMDDMDIIIKAAAPADYTPASYSDQKMKKSDEDMSIPLERTKDIAYEISKKKTHQKVVGFAAESENVIENAKKKIKKKDFDFIVSNNIKQAGAGFKSDTNIVSIIDSDGQVKHYDMLKKREIADIILDKLME
ncbi:bifunctional phosphopantothenoylcysteine decarboxylase/phosphopantothenate--cysteine ligase CoaBC [Acidaminobacter sp. JC074]|uniref:bifunctional phosphopantothenoylcysteine decarboxylase/phosphopantothenate--cysteine ligase CoaBC n=1 Tax=Acidaminobacter sp. JC074 TaxID=2530199 RepID=UPI001F101B9F|nr:bifunctional phosphopantothenoylcysteine decarboxylase/phosphopantothenate--cysteine ligase CoaBC [Acidaminobacter sp. JC074]MCH4890256.1 bifunctional phosphopantothenoylcysteine decarboxylase/phosphopantothenate--cysteine ligase CoaBC [Acidaminobacter sp. JC074]